MLKNFESLEYNKVIEELMELALSDKAKEKIACLTPSLNENKVRYQMKETTDAKDIIERWGNPPLTIMRNISEALEIACKGGMLSVEQLSDMNQFLGACRKMKLYLLKAQSAYNDLAYTGNTLNEIAEVSYEIENAIQGVMVDDRASADLKNIRKKIIVANERVKEKLNALLRGNKSWFADSFVSTRNGRLTLPVKKEYKNKVPGVVVDMSQTGGTCFIEPTTVRKLQDDLYSLQIEEENEIRKILYTLSSLVAEFSGQIKMNIDAMETLDFLFAKGKLSLKMKGAPVEISMDNQIVIQNGRHPLLKEEVVVPLNFEIGAGTTGIVITGPNTGGKTVALKTVGLLSMMVQAGLHVPVGGESRFCLRDIVLCDIGDGQSITENLSTFSSHMSNIIQIINAATAESLVLLDELGSGTDPAEGMGLAVAILEELSKKQCLIVATTHYPEIKSFAEATEGFVNARMAFDRQSLQPLYDLEIGEAGESCALYIAKRLGFPNHMLRKAYEIVYKKPAEHNQNRGGYDEPVFSEANEKQSAAPLPAGPHIQKSIQKEKPKKEGEPRRNQFNIGDNVKIYPEREIGIVYSKADAKGFIGVQVKGRKKFINHKRLKVYVAAKELYPDQYDFSIVFDSVENRKARKKMDKGKGEGIEIQLD